MSPERSASSSPATATRTSSRAASRASSSRRASTSACSSSTTARPTTRPAVATRLAARDPRVEYRRNEENLGLIGTANKGLEWADGDYVVLISADDVLVPGALQRATAVMEADPRSAWSTATRPTGTSAAAPPVSRGAGRARSVWRGADWMRLRCRSGHNCISSPEVVVRTSVQRAVGGYDPGCTHSSDLNMWLRIAAVSDIARVRGIAQAIYRVNPRACCAARTRPSSTCASAARPSTPSSRSSAQQLADADALRAMAGRALARQALWRASRAYDRGLTERPGRAARRRAHRLRARRLPRRAAAARVARPAGPPAHRRRALDALRPLRGHRRRPSRARPRQPAALARPRRLARGESSARGRRRAARRPRGAGRARRRR